MRIHQPRHAAVKVRRDSKGGWTAWWVEEIDNTLRAAAQRVSLGRSSC